MNKNYLVTLIFTIMLTACGQETADVATEDSAEAAEVAEAAEAAVEAVAEDRSVATSAAALPRTDSIEGASVFFISPTDGETVTNPFVVEFGISGMELVKAGDNQAGSGHHHLIIDAGPPDLSMPIPANEHYIHFGDASASTELTLEPGSHTLQLLLGDFLHIPHDPPVLSTTITIVVE